MKKHKALFIAALLLLSVVATVSAATLDGIQIHSTTSGKGPRTVILVHGWTCDESSWQSQAPALAAYYRVITIDLPGHGKSGSPKDGKFSMNLFARAVEAVRSEAKVDRVVLAGHSMGTPVIVQYARLYPQHTAALVFVDGGVNPPPKGGAEGFSAFVKRFAGPGGLKARGDMIRGMFSSSTTPEMQKHILSMMLGAPESTAVGAMESFGDPGIYKEDVFTIPVLGLYAGNGKQDVQYLKTRFPKLEFHQIAGTGHFLMLEKPEEFNRLLKAFLDRQKL
jgi:pimeloyl-ACP methyl ester carboxylesterase